MQSLLNYLTFSLKKPARVHRDDIRELDQRKKKYVYIFAWETIRNASSWPRLSDLSSLLLLSLDFIFVWCPQRWFSRCAHAVPRRKLLFFVHENFVLEEYFFFFVFSYSLPFAWPLLFVCERVTRMRCQQLLREERGEKKEKSYAKRKLAKALSRSVAVCFSRRLTHKKACGRLQCARTACCGLGCCQSERVPFSNFLPYRA